MEVHMNKVQSEELEFGMCEFEAKDLETLETHLVTCQIYECKHCAERWKSISDIKKHMTEEHKGGQFLKIIHAKLDISNSDEIKCKSYYCKDLLSEKFSTENNLNERRPQWKTTSMEDNLKGRRPKWKTNSMEDDLNGK